MFRSSAGTVRCQVSPVGGGKAPTGRRRASPGQTSTRYDQPDKQQSTRTAATSGQHTARRLSRACGPFLPLARQLRADLSRAGRAARFARGDLVQFQSFLRALASRSAQLLNLADLAGTWVWRPTPRRRGCRCSMRRTRSWCCGRISPTSASASSRHPSATLVLIESTKPECRRPLLLTGGHGTKES